MRPVLLAVVLLAGAACGDSGSPTTAPPAETSSTSSTFLLTSPNTTAHPTTTTTIAPTTTVVVSIPPTTGPGGGPSLFPPDPLPGSDGANGSGCSTGEGALPDGVWFGFVRGHGASRIDFDLACFYFGDVAEQKAAEQGEEAPSGFFISNQNDTIRRVDLDPATPVNWIVAPPNAELRFETTPYVDWVDDPEGYSNCPGESCIVWLYVDGGTVTGITEQYVP